MNPSTQRNPVLLIHGMFDTQAIFRRMIGCLKQWGWEVHSLDLIPNNATCGLEKLTMQVVDYIDKHFPPDQPLDLVGFSMGGIISRYYIQRLGGIERVKRLIAIASPHQGTMMGYFYPSLGAAQMRPDSELLQDLNQDLYTLERLSFTSIWTPYDLMIIPANSSRIPVGKEIIINVVAHAWMVSDIRCIKSVAEALTVEV